MRNYRNLKTSNRILALRCHTRNVYIKRCERNEKKYFRCKWVPKSGLLILIKLHTGHTDLQDKWSQAVLRCYTRNVYCIWGCERSEQKSFGKLCRQVVKELYTVLSCCLLQFSFLRDIYKQPIGKCWTRI